MSEEKAPGLEEYTPTRLDWLAIKLNSIVSHWSLSQNGIHFLFLAGDDGKSIELFMRHYSDMDEERIVDLINTLEEFALKIAKDYGWDSWIEFKKDIIKQERKK